MTVLKSFFSTLLTFMLNCYTLEEAFVLALERKSGESQVWSFSIIDI